MQTDSRCLLPGCTRHWHSPRGRCIVTIAAAVGSLGYPGGAGPLLPPELLKPYEAGNLAVPAFQVFQFPDAMDGTTVGGLTYTEVRKREMSWPEAAEIPNGVMFMVDLLPSGEINGHVKYNRAEFLQSTAEKLIGDYREILTRAVAEPTIGPGEL